MKKLVVALVVVVFVLAISLVYILTQKNKPTYDPSLYPTITPTLKPVSGKTIIMAPRGTRFFVDGKELEIISSEGNPEISESKSVINFDFKYTVKTPTSQSKIKARLGDFKENEVPENEVLEPSAGSSLPMEVSYFNLTKEFYDKYLSSQAYKYVEAYYEFNKHENDYLDWITEKDYQELMHPTMYMKMLEDTPKNVTISPEYAEISSYGRNKMDDIYHCSVVVTAFKGIELMYMHEISFVNKDGKWIIYGHRKV